MARVRKAQPRKVFHSSLILKKILGNMSPNVSVYGKIYWFVKLFYNKTVYFGLRRCNRRTPYTVLGDPREGGTIFHYQPTENAMGLSEAKRNRKLYKFSLLAFFVIRDIKHMFVVKLNLHMVV